MCATEQSTVPVEAPSPDPLARYRELRDRLGKVEADRIWFDTEPAPGGKGGNR